MLLAREPRRTPRALASDIARFAGLLADAVEQGRTPAAADIKHLDDAVAVLLAHAHTAPEVPVPAESSRDDDVPVAAGLRPPREDVPALPKPGASRDALADPPDPRPDVPWAEYPRLSKRRADAVLAAAHLKRSPDYADTHRWWAVDEHGAVLYTVSPTGLSGRRDWFASVHGIRGDHWRTRQDAAADGGRRWLNQATRVTGPSEQ